MLAKLTIKSRLILTLLVMVAFLIGIEMLGLFGMSKAIDGVKTIHQDRMAPLRQIAEIQSRLLRTRLAIASALLNPAPANIRRTIVEVERNTGEIAGIWREYNAAFFTGEEGKLAVKLERDHDRFIAEGVGPAMHALAENNGSEARRLAIDRIVPLYAPVEEGLRSLAKLQLDEVKKKHDEERERYETIRAILLASIAVALLLAALIVLMFRNALFQPLRKAVDTARGVAAGNFLQEIKPASKDEIGQLMQALKEMRDSLLDAIVQIRVSQAHLNALLENLIDGVAVLDERGIIKTFNPAAEHIFGYMESEMIGQHVNLLFPAPATGQSHSADYFLRWVQIGTSAGPGTSCEETGLRKDGTHFSIDLALVETHHGENRGFAAIVRDISARKLVEEQRSHLMEDLKKANEELTEFAYVVSHDLKSPLRAISSLANWLSVDYGDKLGKEGKEYMTLLVNRVERMSNLIDGILQYSRIGRVKEALVELDLNQLVSETIDLLFRPSNVTISIDGVLPKIIGEPIRIQQVFQNLLSNAIKYMDKPHGEIRIQARADGEQWEFSISDNGPGIEARHFEKIFHLFQTLAPRDRVESTGVGLALVKKIVEMYGGQVWLESAAGKGSTFFFTWPAIAPTTH